MGRYISLYLNGYNVARNNTSSFTGNVFDVFGDMVLTDGTGGGKVTGGYHTGDGGGVIIYDGGTFTLTGNAAISGNTASSGSGGGVYVNGGVFNMTGGEISGNTGVYNHGGGVYMRAGAFNMSSGRIIGNITQRWGGGLWAEGGAFNMSGGEISGNSIRIVSRNGGGVYMDVKNSTIQLSGTARITGNTNGAGVPNNLTLENGKTASVGVLSGNALIGVTTKPGATQSKPAVFTAPNTKQYIGYFASDSDGYIVESGANNALQLKSKFTVVTLNQGTGSGGTYSYYAGYGEEVPSEVKMPTASEPGTLFHGYYTGAGGTGPMVINANGKYIPNVTDFTDEDSLWTYLKTSDVTLYAGYGSPIASVTYNNVTTIYSSFEEAWANATSYDTNENNRAVVTLHANVGTQTNPFGNQPLVVESGKFLTIDLQGYSLNRGLTARQTDGNVITVSGDLILKGTADGKVTGGWNSADGGGVIVMGGGSLTLEGGKITGNNVARNNNGNDGGGVMVNSYGRFTINGGAVSGNSGRSGGVYVPAGGTVVMKGGEISDNNASHLGGGVYINGGSFLMSGGEIKNNVNSYANGGGVLLRTGELHMSSGVISGNTAGSNGLGGGIYFEGGALKLSGNPQITGNNVYDGNLYLLSGRIIKLADKLTEGADIGISVSAGPSTGIPVDITHEHAFGYMSGYFTPDNKDCITINTLSGSNSKVQLALKGNTAATVTVGAATTSYDSFRLAWDAALSAGSATVRLYKNVSAAAGNAPAAWPITVPGGKNITLDLCGMTINRGLTAGDENGHVINISDSSESNATTFTITDTSTAGNPGRITGGRNTGNGGGVYVGRNCTLTLSGRALITGNKTDGTTTGQISGGGVYVAGTLDMTGGVIRGNTTGGEGGGVYINESAGVFNMSGAARVFLNTAGNYGGGVCVREGELNISGNAVITENTTQSSMPGGGVFVTDGGRLSLADSAQITGNVMNGTISGSKLNGGTNNNLYLMSGKTAAINSALTSGAEIGVTTADAPTSAAAVPVTGGSTADYSASFSSDIRIIRS